MKEPLTFGCQPEKVKAILYNLGFNQVKIISMRELNHIYCGSGKIEDSYFFATAEMPKDSDLKDNFIKQGNLYVRTEYIKLN